MLTAADAALLAEALASAQITTAAAQAAFGTAWTVYRPSGDGISAPRAYLPAYDSATIYVIHRQPVSVQVQDSGFQGVRRWEGTAPDQAGVPADLQLGDILQSQAEPARCFAIDDLDDQAGYRLALLHPTGAPAA